MPGNFRELVAYRLAIELARQLHRSVVKWPRLERDIIGGQLLRAAYSVGSNIAEASGRWHMKDRQRFLVVARGSLYETEHWIVSAQAQGLLPPDTEERIDEIARTLNGLIRAQAKDA